MKGIELPAQMLVVYLLLHLRFIGLMYGCPLFSSPMFPTPFRYLFAVLLTAAALGLVKPQEITLLYFENVVTLVVLGVRELLVGIALGFLASLPLTAVQVAGEQTGTVIGFSMAQVMDPMTQTQTSILGQLNLLMTMWFYFHWNGHLLMIQAVIESLKLVPMGQLSPFPAGDVGIGTWLQGLFTLSMRMVLPFYCALVLSDIGLGFLARTVPQMNIFVVGLPVKVMLGFMVYAVVLPLTVDLVFAHFERWIEFALGELLFWRPAS